MSSRWSSVLLAATVLTFGCASPGTIGDVQQKARAEPPPLALTVPDPDGAVLTMIGPQEPVRLGESYETALRAFPRPPDAIDVRDAAPTVGVELLSRGWDTGTQAFAALSQNERVVLAINTIDRTDEANVRDLVQGYEAHLGRPADSVVGGPGPPINYWFWQSGDQRLMICQTVNATGRMSVTVVLGLAPLMDRLRMNVGEARSDRRAAQRALETTRAPSPAP